MGMRDFGALRLARVSYRAHAPPHRFDDASHCCGPTAGMAMSGQIPLEHFDKLDFVLLTEDMVMKWASS